MRPGEIACRHQNPDLTNCGAEVNEPCRQWQDEAMPLGRDGKWFHSERRLDAVGIGDPAAEEISVDALAAIVERMGLV